MKSFKIESNSTTNFFFFFFADEFYNRYIVKGNLLSPVVDAFLRNNGRYNLLDSAILELFEFIKMEDIKSLCVYVVDTFGRALDKVEYVQTFKCLRLRYDQQQERITERSTSALDRYFFAICTKNPLQSLVKITILA